MTVFMTDVWLAGLDVYYIGPEFIVFSSALSVGDPEGKDEANIFLPGASLLSGLCERQLG